MTPPNHALQRTRPSRLGCKRAPSWAGSPEVEARARAATAEFHALQVSQRPTFVIESDIGDKAVFSGLAVAEPLIATIEAMSRDEAGYAAHKAHFGGPPA